MTQTAIMEPGPEDTAGQRFLTEERIERIGELVAPLVITDLSWVERRKDSVEILDDTALRRQISVDFSLRSNTKPLIQEEEGESLYCAPIYVLPKTPANLMSFDLEDENGQALTLISRTDNARISGATLRAMAQTILEAAGETLTTALEARLQALAEADAARGPQLASQLLNGGQHSAQMGVLGQHSRFKWWLESMAHSSLVVVLFRARSPRRKLVKLSFEQPIALEKQRWLTRLGWTPYKVGVDTSLIEARSYHFEAQAPPGLRITDARLSDDTKRKPECDSGFLKRVHLYRHSAQTAGAGVGLLWLAVSGSGFVGGALSAAFLVSVALAACAYAAGEIAANPTSAPALLLALPALIASYVARPDQHALTSRLLSGARQLLLAAAFLAYAAAAYVALGGKPATPDQLLDRTDALEKWLTLAAAASAIPLIGLSITCFHNRRQMLRRLSFSNRCYHSCFVAAPPDALYGRLKTAAREQAGPFSDYEFVEHDVDARVTTVVQSRWHGTWLVRIGVQDADGNSTLTCSSEHVNQLRGLPVAPLLTRRHGESIDSLLKSFQDQAVKPEPG